MKKLILIAGLVGFSSSGFALNEASTKCGAYARSVMNVALHGNTVGLFTLDDVKTSQEKNDESGVNLTVETLSYSTEAAYVVVKTYPNLNGDGKCQLSSMSVSRH